MAISGVNPKCYILALFVRDDGARFLLGDDPFEFKDKQLHFQQNTIANDVVEVQGNDGYLLAGQVRRPGSQMFDGYVCNGTNSKEEVEVKRRAFLQFFRRSHFYKVIYVFPNGTAIQRKQGFLVDDPTVQELYQQYPEYHVALNFEDVNYYTYEEDDQGQEIYAKEAIIKLAGGGATGGLIWDNYGVVWEDSWSDLVSVSGTEMQIENEAGVRAPIENLELQGDTYQQSYSGYNLIDLVPITNTQPTRYQQCTFETVMDGTLGRNVLHITGTNNYPSVVYRLPQRLESGKYYALKFTYRSALTGTAAKQVWFAPNWGGNDWDVLGSLNAQRCKSGDGDTSQTVDESTAWKTTSRRFYVDPAQYTSAGSSYTLICFSLGYNQNSSKEVWLADAEVYEITEDEWNADTYTSKDYEPYTGAIPAPNPDYPQEVQTVTGEQTVMVYGGKNLLPFSNEDFTINNVRFYAQNGNIYLDGTASNSISSNNTGFKRNFAWILPAGTYAMSIDNYDYDPSAQFFLHKSDQSDIAVIGKNTAQSKTFTLTEDTGVYIGVYCPSGTVFQNKLLPIQIEVGSTASSYESFHNQSYDVDLRGKNILNISDFAMGGLSNGNPATSNYRIQNANHPIAVQPNTTYTLSAQLVSPVQGFRVGIHEIGRDGVFLRDLGWKQLGTGAFTMTTNPDAYYLKMVGSLSTTSTNVTTGGTENTTACTTVTEFMRGCTLMLEKGSTATDYEPYNAIELCKIGDYQDYIYKSGDDWYVHKECMNRILDSSSEWGVQGYGGHTYISGYNQHYFDDASTDTSNITVKSSQFTPVSWDNRTLNTQNSIYINLATPARPRLEIRNVEWASVTDVVTWFTTHPATVYYVLATATDTQITDATLVGQLNALGAMKLFIGENNLLVSATGSNLPATLEFSYPTKFATIGAEWEEGGTKGATIVNVDAIDNTYPVWELIGPATNPTLSVLTTNTTLTYNGTITASQKLVIDMFNKTATLNGTSVIGNISGDFVYMAPGTNRLAYTAGNTDAPDSTIYWQEVVG